MSDEYAVVQDEPSKKVLGLPFALGIAIILAILMTCVSVGVYYVAGFYKLDLSRPGYEAEREDITTSTTQKTYDTTSPITSKALDEFLTEYDTNTTTLKAYGDFGDTASLSDDALSL